MNDEAWEYLPLEGRSVREVVYSGNGKDGGVTITLDDGIDIGIYSHNVAISATSAVQITVHGIDDANLSIALTGPGLTVDTARINNWFHDPDERAEFRTRIAEWAASGYRGDEGYNSIELRLTARS